MIRNRTAAQPIARDGVRMLVNGRRVIAMRGDDTLIFDHGEGRCSITARDAARPISITTEDDDEWLNYDAAQRVREAAARPPARRSDRPSAQQAAVRTAARQYHEATWNHGFNEGQARYEARPLNERVTENDVPELIELCMRRVLGDPELCDLLRAAMDAADVDRALAAAPPAVPTWIAQRQAG